jgi:hypothetical protein
MSSLDGPWAWNYFTKVILLLTVTLQNVFLRWSIEQYKDYSSSLTVMLKSNFHKKKPSKGRIHLWKYWVWSSLWFLFIYFPLWLGVHIKPINGGSHPWNYFTKVILLLTVTLQNVFLRWSIIRFGFVETVVKSKMGATINWFNMNTKP